MTRDESVPSADREVIEGMLVKREQDGEGVLEILLHPELLAARRQRVLRVMAMCWGGSVLWQAVNVGMMWLPLVLSLGLILRETWRLLGARRAGMVLSVEQGGVILRPRFSMPGDKSVRVRLLGLVLAVVSFGDPTHAWLAMQSNADPFDLPLCPAFSPHQAQLAQQRAADFLGARGLDMRRTPLLGDSGPWQWLRWLEWPPNRGWC